MDDLIKAVDPTEDFLRETARSLFGRSRGSHDWEHTQRVWRLCRRIGHVEGADRRVLGAAAYLHDIGRIYQDRSNGAVCHAVKGAQMAGDIIESLPFSPEQKQNILHCIRAHRFRSDRVPDTLEAKVLFDADKLDSIGAVGVARAFLFAGEVGARLHNPDVEVSATRPYTLDDTGYREFKLKLCRIKDRILTREGRRLARRRHDVMVEFFHHFIAEYEGEE